MGYPGSVHDARVFKKSGMAQKCRENVHFPNNSHLLGDSAYPLGPHILVPFKDNGHLSRTEIKYNIAHAASRVSIERAFGILKSRWRRLRYLELHNTENLPIIISAACVVHNLCLLQNDIHLDDITVENDPIDPVEFNPVLERNGSQKRIHIANNL